MDITVHFAVLPYKEVGHVDWVYSEYLEEPAGNKWKQERRNEGDQVTDGRF